MRVTILGDVVAHPSYEKCPEHIRKREQEQSAATESIDCPDSRPRESEVDKTEAKRRNESFLVRGSSLCEDR